MDDAVVCLLLYALPIFSHGRSLHPHVEGSESSERGEIYSSFFSPAEGLCMRWRRSIEELTELEVGNCPRYLVSSPEEYVEGTREENE